jgi:hypothetical protein
MGQRFWQSTQALVPAREQKAWFLPANSYVSCGGTPLSMLLSL